MGKVFYPRSNNTKMKSHATKTSARRKQRRAHFTAPSHIRYRLMSAGLNKELRNKRGIRSMPIRKEDEVLVVRGKFKTSAGKVNQVYRSRWCIYIDGLSKSKL